MLENELLLASIRVETAENGFRKEKKTAPFQGTDGGSSAAAEDRTSSDIVDVCSRCRGVARSYEIRRFDFSCYSGLSVTSSEGR